MFEIYHDVCQLQRTQQHNLTSPGQPGHQGCSIQDKFVASMLTKYIFPKSLNVISSQTENPTLKWDI